MTEKQQKTENRKQKTESPNPLRICVPVVETTVNRARGLYLRAARRGLWTEMRLDYLEKPDLPRLFRTRPGPVIATNRRREEGGQWAGAEAERLALLEECLTYGVDFLDVELAVDAAWRRELPGRRGAAGIILSWHDFDGTPESGRLEAVLEEMVAAEAQVVKMVTLARKPEDNLRVLSLIPKAKAQGREIIAFCMGPLGMWSRVAAPLLGSFLTFAPFSKRGASAPGQITINKLHRLWRLLTK
ncbi:MAG: type I 3-dehydroquinate dehydratase [Deltaproteobacteria bacterium]|nr:type I 3-dehydroquinate dehydratase [Deltaproteobacteria bacterium]